MLVLTILINYVTCS